MSTSPFDLSKMLQPGLSGLRPIKREGNRVTYDSFLFVGKSFIVEVKSLTVELPPEDSTRIEQGASDADSTTYSVTALAPNIVNVEFGTITPFGYETPEDGGAS